jgi:hypothetical protein
MVVMWFLKLLLQQKDGFWKKKFIAVTCVLSTQ